MLSKRCSVLPCFGPQPKHARMLRCHATPNAVRWELRLLQWRLDPFASPESNRHVAAAGMTQATTTS